MASKRQFATKSYAKVIIFLVTVLLACSHVFAGAQDTISQPPRFRVQTLRHIPAQQGIKYLSELKLATVSQLPGTNTLLITATATDLIKASTVLELVDSVEPYTIKVILPAANPEDLPPADKIETKLADISIGTFENPPKGTEKAKAIVDLSDGKVIAIAPTKRIAEIASTVEHLYSAIAAQSTEPNKPPQPSPVPQRTAAVKSPAPVPTPQKQPNDELFTELLSSLAETEKAGSEPNQTGPSPLPVPEEKPIAATAPPEQSIQPLVGSEQTAERPQSAQEPMLERETVQPQKPPEPTKPIPSYTPVTAIDGNEVLDLVLPEKLDIVDLLSLVGTYLHLDYMYDPAKVKGDVTFKLQGKLSGKIRLKDLYPLLESVLKFRGFVMSRKGNLVTIVPRDEALEIDPTLLVPERGKLEAGDVIVTRAFQLEYIDTTSATNLLTKMKLGVNVTPIADTGTLFVTGYAYRMPRIEKLLRMVDKPGKPRQFRFRQLRYTMAKTLAPKLKSLVEQLGEISITVAAPKQPTPVRGQRIIKRPITKPPTSEPSKPTVYLDADERTNRILMIGQQDELDIVEQLIDSLDVAQQDLRTLRLYDIQHVGADEVKKKLEELGIIGATKTTPTTRRTITTGKTSRSSTPPAARTTTTEGPLVEQPQVIVIDSTNSLLVNATAEQHIQVATVIGYVDNETIERAIPYEIYPLENQDPEALAGILNQLVQETVKDKEGKIQQVIKKKEEEITIIGDKNTFSLIVNASKKNQEWIRKLISVLDKRRPQVLINVSLVEITRDDQFSYDLNVIANAKKAVTGNIGVSGSTLPISATATALEGGWNLKDAQGTNTGKVQGFYAEDKIQALLAAMDKKNYGRILAQPKVLVNDNEEGVIKTEERTYVEESTTSYTDQGIPITTSKWTEYPAKIQLSITPNISEGNLLRLRIDMLREDFEKKVSAPPDYTTSQVTTTVTVPDGSTIILGGLTKLKQSKGGNKVPLIGDIPLIGGLFRSVSNTDKANKLYIFVKATILRPDQTVGLGQLQQISDKNKLEFEKEEERFQRKEDWPGLKAEPIEPLKILSPG